MKLHPTAYFMVSLSGAGLATAQDALQTLEPLTVVGSQEEVFKQVGSAAFIGSEEIRQANALNVNEVLAKVPGVYVREEDGYGNFPNISLRGADGTRSEKVTIMEDGILTAPSPYSAPAAYYTPRIARMAGVEVLKGSSQVRYGPQTTAGVINYLSTGIPAEQGFYSRTTYGSDNTFFNHTWFGDTADTQVGRIGYLLELHAQTSDGYRDTDFTNRDSGFNLIEPMLKLFWEPNTSLKQRLEFKVGYTDFDSNETYTGLSNDDVESDPDRRYAATRFDEFDSEHWRTYLKWVAEPSDLLRLESAVYFNSFERSWNKLDQVNGTALHEGLLDPARIAVLNGSTPGTIRLTDNIRAHESYGWQNQVNFRFETGTIEHDLAVGARFHYDRVDADRRRTTYNGVGNGDFNLSLDTGTTFNGINEAFATALFVEDEIRIDRLTIRPGIRYEWLELDFTDAAGAQFSGNENLFMAGVGLNYEVDNSNSIFGGAYRGASPASPEAYLVTGTESEESMGYEIGYRHRQDAFQAEVTGFYTDFSQLISTDAGLGSSNTAENAGEADVFGIEGLVQYDLAKPLGKSFGLPVYASATWTKAEFKNTTAALAGGGDDVYAGGKDGNEIPYVPEWKLAAGIGYVAENWGVNLDANYASSTWGTGYNGDARVGTPSIRDGETDALLIFNLSANYRINENFKLLAGVHNLFDERGIVSRIPEGPRANSPRTLYTGIEAKF
ncbi:MAG: TonB-dependent receptor [Akkermansiaceae bacterium]